MEHQNSEDTQEPATPDPWETLRADPELAAMQMAVDDIQDIKRIYYGCSGDFRLVKYRNTRLLASNRLQLYTKKGVQRTVDTVKQVAKFDHPNIVALVGIVWTQEPDLPSLFEYVGDGNLREYVFNPATPREWNTEKLKIAIGISEALAYLHSFMPPVVLGELRSREVLLTDKLEPKLLIFDTLLWKLMTPRIADSMPTVRWKAPEAIFGDEANYDHHADIYCFGVLLSELDTHEFPYEHAVGPDGRELLEVRIKYLVMTDRLRPEFTPKCPPELQALGNRCLAHNPKDRPEASEIAYQLRMMLQTMPEHQPSLPSQ